ncbi:MAG TPA: TIGR02679 family protein [Euzebyales bacterium]|nr:TIGR02679 family protein [Euzebyales bacterium]
MTVDRTRHVRVRAWAAVFDDADALADRVPALRPWRDELVDTGLLRQLSRGNAERAGRLVDQCRAVVERLPERGVAPSRLASAAGGDAPGLDPGRPLSTLVLKAAACISGVPWGLSAEAQRTVWASVGVLTGALGNPVLTLGLPGDAVSTTGRALAVWRDAGQPVHLTLRQLVRDPPRLPVEMTVFVCENSSVVLRAADEVGARCAPLVCIESHPAAAQFHLLRLCSQAGADLRYHGDFDWTGITIANGVMGRFSARPWRYGTSDYNAAVSSGAGTPMQRRPMSAIWDDRLAPAMRRHLRRIEEEHVITDLLADLSP